MSQEKARSTVQVLPDPGGDMLWLADSHRWVNSTELERPMGTPDLDEAKGWARGQWEPGHWGLNRVPPAAAHSGERGGQQHHPLILA